LLLDQHGKHFKQLGDVRRLAVGVEALLAGEGLDESEGGWIVEALIDFVADATRFAARRLDQTLQKRRKLFLFPGLRGEVGDYDYWALAALERSFVSGGGQQLPVKGQLLRFEQLRPLRAKTDDIRHLSMHLEGVA